MQTANTPEDCCTFYTEPDFMGEELRLCHPIWEPMEFDLRGHSWNDNISSYRCGKFCNVDLCNDPSDMSCEYGNGNHAAGKVSVSQVGHDDMVTFIRINPYDAALPDTVAWYNTPAAATWFDGLGCTGNSGRLYAM